MQGITKILTDYSCRELAWEAVLGGLQWDFWNKSNNGTECTKREPGRISSHPPCIFLASPIEIFSATKAIARASIVILQSAA